MIIKWSYQLFWPIIEDSSFPTKLIMLPVTLVCYLTIFIVKFSITMHLVVFPLAKIVSAVIKLELAFSIFHSIFNVSFVSAATFNIGFHIFTLTLTIFAFSWWWFSWKSFRVGYFYILWAWWLLGLFYFN